MHAHAHYLQLALQTGRAGGLGQVQSGDGLVAAEAVGHERHRLPRE